MPSSNNFNPLYPAAPLSPTGNLTDFDVQAAELARRRRMAELLQQQGMNWQQSTPGRASLLGPIAAMMQVGMGKREADDINRQEQEMNRQRSEALSGHLRDFPTGDLPAREENAPVGVEGEAPVGPILPAQPAQTQAQQLVPWALKMGTIGGRFGQNIADEIIKPALQRMLPLSPEAEARIGEVTEARKARTEEAAARREEARLKQIEDLKFKDRQLVQQLEIHKDNSALKREIEADRNENRLALKALVGAVAGSGKAHDSNLIGEGGERLVVNPQGELHATLPDGTISKTPYAGTTTPRTTVEKNVGQIQETQRGVAEMESVLKALKTPAGKEAFSPRAAFGSFVPNIAGIGTAAQGIGPEQVTLRAQAASATADITHSLYGSAFSAGEQQRAKDFLISPRDDAATVEAKLKGRLSLEKAHLERQPGAATAAAAARSPAKKTIRFDAQGNELP